MNRDTKSYINPVFPIKYLTFYPPTLTKKGFRNYNGSTRLIALNVVADSYPLFHQP